MEVPFTVCLPRTLHQARIQTTAAHTNPHLRPHPTTFPSILTLCLCLQWLFFQPPTPEPANWCPYLADRRQVMGDVSRRCQDPRVHVWQRRCQLHVQQSLSSEVESYPCDIHYYRSVSDTRKYIFDNRDFSWDRAPSVHISEAHKLTYRHLLRFLVRFKVTSQLPPPPPPPKPKGDPGMISQVQVRHTCTEFLITINSGTIGSMPFSSVFRPPLPLFSALMYTGHRGHELWHCRWQLATDGWLRKLRRIAQLE